MNIFITDNIVCKCEDIILFSEMYPEYNNNSIMHNNFVFNRIHVNHISDELLLDNIRDDYYEDESEEERFNSDYVCMHELEPKAELTIGNVADTIRKYSIPNNYTIHVKYRDTDTYAIYREFCAVNKFCLAQSWDKQEFIYFGCSKCIDYKLLDLFKFSDIPKKHNI